MSVQLTYLGGRTFAVSYRGIRFYLEPEPGLETPSDADLVTITGPESLNPPALAALLTASARAKVVMPKSLAEAAHAAGIPYERMTTTDAALRVEYFKHGEYGRVYGVPAARHTAAGPQLDWHPIGGFPRIAFMARFGATTVWHSGTGVPYPELGHRLMPYAVNAAIVTLGPAYFSELAAAELTEALQAGWLIAAGEDEANKARFLDHLLGHRPQQRFKVFAKGETWEIPGS